MTRTGVLSRLLRERFDPAFGRVIRFLSDKNPFVDPVLTRLAPHRRQAMRRAAEEFAPRAAALEEAVVARDPEAVARYDELLDQAVARMRSLPTARTSGAFDLTPLVAAVERRLYRDAPERIDDPNFPEEERTEALEKLDQWNRTIGSYHGFVSVLAPLIEAAERAGRSPVRIHDVATGHAGFALALKAALGDGAIVEASDIKSEYLELGRARAEDLGVQVDFYMEDALAMDEKRERGVDIVLCTQALHHFAPGMVARMIGEASRASRVGACFIDGERSWLTLAMFVPAATLFTRNYTLVHDGIVSIRRMYYREELALLGALAPGVPEGARIETGGSHPGYGYLRLTRCGFFSDKRPNDHAAAEGNAVERADA